jgi:hypothetical protein
MATSGSSVDDEGWEEEVEETEEEEEDENCELRRFVSKDAKLISI